MKKLLLVLSVSVSILPLWGQLPQSSVDSLFSKWDKADAPGCALGIVQNGKLTYAKGYGIADLEHDLPIAPNSVFYIGSVSKQFVTFCILLLEEEGKINLDDKIQAYLPDFPEYGNPLTIRNFIHHTSGVRDYLTLMSLKGRNYLDHIEEEEVYELIKRQEELNFTPGEKYLYSNSCYFMLAMIIEKAAGESLGSFAHKNIFQPLGMKNTLFYDDNRKLIKNRVFSYYPTKDGYENLIMRFDLVGSGGIYSTIEDLYLWNQNFYNNKLGKGGQAIIDRMHEEGLLNNGESCGYAFALNNGTYKGLRTVSHGGALAGYRAELMRFPDQEFSVIILANRGDFNPTGMAYQVADLYLKEQFVSKPNKEIAKAPIKKETKVKRIFEPTQLIGKYEIAPGLIAEVSLENDSVHVKQVWNGGEYNIYRTSGNTFEIPNVPNLQFTFLDLRNDCTQLLSVLQNGKTTEAKRVNDVNSSDFKQEDFVGKYYCKELDANYQIGIGEKGLEVEMPSNGVYALTPTKKDEFRIEDLILRFQRTAGAVTSLELDAGRVQNLKFKKL